MSGSNPDVAPNCSNYLGPVEIQMRADGRGRGLFATKDIKAGTLVMVSKAIAFSRRKDQHAIETGLNEETFTKLVNICMKSKEQLQHIYLLHDGAKEIGDINTPSMCCFGPNKTKSGALRKLISSHGVGNSFLNITPMPIVSTSQVLGNTECFEPYTSNMYGRAGDQYEKNILFVIDLANEYTVKAILMMQWRSIPQIPNDLKAIYRCTLTYPLWPLAILWLFPRCFIHQNQSLNVRMDLPNFGKLTSLHCYIWSKVCHFINITNHHMHLSMTTILPSDVDKEASNPAIKDMETKMSQMVCSLKNRDECIACRS
ncbi:hypothetical protein L7F22_036114 [Adiantum nelumboides]|nr:hypothetical protein [Adiantum nelumboides]